MKTPSKPKPPASQPRRIWRLLERGEKIMKGDQWWGNASREWKPLMAWQINTEPPAGYVHRRRILVCGYRELKGRGKS